jgi:hypothetical protein
VAAPLGCLPARSFRDDLMAVLQERWEDCHYVIAPVFLLLAVSYMPKYEINRYDWRITNMPSRNL